MRMSTIASTDKSTVEYSRVTFSMHTFTIMYQMLLGILLSIAMYSSTH